METIPMKTRAHLCIMWWGVNHPTIGISQRSVGLPQIWICKTRKQAKGYSPLDYSPYTALPTNDLTLITVFNVTHVKNHTYKIRENVENSSSHGGRHVEKELKSGLQPTFILQKWQWAESIFFDEISRKSTDFLWLLRLITNPVAIGNCVLYVYSLESLIHLVSFPDFHRLLIMDHSPINFQSINQFIYSD
jgi:hypothetical protein